MEVIVLSHGPLAKALTESCCFILDEGEELWSLCLDEEGIDVFGQRLREKLNTLEGKKVLFFCDLCHGSPHNQLLIQLLDYKGRFEYKILTGMNLPMLMQTQLLSDTENLQEAYESCKKMGMEGIV